MIRHRPLGSGHPYAPDTEQRWPTLPVAGEPLRLGVRTSGEVTAVTLQLRVDGGPVSSHPLVPVPRSSRGQALDGGHLASAQARKARQAGGWQVELPGPSGTLRYRFVAAVPAGEQLTRWFTVKAATWQAAADDLLEVAGVAVAVRPGSVHVLSDGDRLHRLRFTLPLAPHERVVGFGERFDTLDQRGLTLDSVVFEQYKNQGAHRRTYLPMPFAHVVGGQGWGFHVQTTRRVWFDVGATAADELVVEAEVAVAEADRPALTLALYSGTPTEVLDAFLNEVGRPRELPDWVFRLWASGNEWNTQREVERQLRLHAEHEIPIGNLVIEAWSDESSFTIFRDARYTVREDGTPARLADFSFPPDGAWPDPKGMADRMHGQGVKLHLWQIPLVKMRPHPGGQAKADAETGVAKGFLVREPDAEGRLRPYRNRGWWFPLGLMPDLTDAEAADWWTAKRRYLVEEVGVDGFKTDGGEHAWGQELVYRDGSRGDARNNTFPVGYAAAFGRLLESCGKPPVTFSRAGFTGSQAHGAYWAGDENSTWQAFRWSMLAGLNAAACGIVYWGWDVAGFSGPVPGAELYVRAMAASAFVPIMQYHSEFNHHRLPPRDRTPWNVVEQSGDTAVIDDVRRIVALRERLVPYLAAQASQAVSTSRPLLRPLFFDHPDDPKVWEHPIQWTLGDSILVAPVLEPGVEAWPVYLPDGDWVDAWTGARVSGGQLRQVSTPRYRVPAFVRAGDWDGLKQVFAG